MMSLSWSLRSATKAMLRHLLVPPMCAACDIPLGDSRLFCVACGLTVERCTRAQEGVHCAFQYGGAVVTAVWRLKYGRRTDLAHGLGLAIATMVEGLGVGGVRAVVPVPLHEGRLAERGYNQSALLGHRVAQYFRAAHAPGALRRVRFTPSQVGLSRDERRHNVAEAFAFNPRAGVPRESQEGSVVLVDDVCTTGATLRACREALKRAGVSPVIPVAVLRGGGHHVDM